LEKSPSLGNKLKVETRTTPIGSSNYKIKQMGKEKNMTRNQYKSNTNSVVKVMKELIPDPSQKIKLDEYVSNHIRNFLDATDLKNFPVQTPSVSKEDFLDRIQRYEDLTKDLKNISILLAYWGDSDQLSLLEKIFTRIAEADKGTAGITLWLKLGWYPVLLLMYAAGIAALSKHKYEALKIILEAQVHSGFEYDSILIPVIVPVVDNVTNINGNFELLPEYEKHYYPRSEHLFKSLQPSLEDLLFLGKSYEPLFDRFELFLALVYADVKNGDWGPPGRFAWKCKPRAGKGNPFMELVDEAKKYRDGWVPLKAGFFQRSYKRFQEIVDSYKKLLKNY